MQFDKHWLITPILIACLLLAPSVARAVVVFRKGEDKPTMGFLLREDENQVVVRRPVADGRFRDEIFLRSEIADLIYTVQSDRLEALRADRPKAYRDYADELAAKRQDPEARYTAIRLYLIAAHLDPAGEGRSAMLGMIALARNESEEARFRAMAYLLDRDHDQSVLKTPQLTVDSPTSLDAAAKEKLVEVLQQVRRGNQEQARSLLNNETIRKNLVQFDGLVSYGDLLRAAGSDTALPSTLRKIVALELALSARGETAGNSRSARKPDDLSWQQALNRDGTAPLPVLSLESLTEFNPRECRYQDGKWIDPDA